MTEEEILNKVRSGYYEPEYEQFKEAEQTEQGEIKTLRARIDWLREKVEKRKQEWWKEQRKLEGDRMDEFKKDCLEYFGLTNHPKGREVWAMAWNRGHSNGLEDIYYELSELAGLLQ